MGDAQKRKVSSGNAGSRSAIGDSKEVGDIATTCSNKEKGKFSAKRRLSGDSPFIGQLLSSAEKNFDEAEKAIDAAEEWTQDPSTCKQIHLKLVNTSDMDPGDFDEYEDVEEEDGSEECVNDSPSTANDTNISTPPRKVLSFNQNVEVVSCTPKKTFSLSSNLQPSSANRDASMYPQSSNVNENERTVIDNQGTSDEFSKRNCPRKAFSLEQKVGEQLEYLKKTTSLVTNFNTREECLQRESSKYQSVSGTSTVVNNESGTNATSNIESQIGANAVSSVFLDQTADSKAVISILDGNAEQEVKRRRGYTYEGMRESVLDNRAGILVLNEMLENIGMTLPDADDKKKSAVSFKDPSSAEIDRSEQSSIPEQSCSQKALQHRLQQECQQKEGVCGQSLQSTCDLSSWSLCHYHSLPQWMQDNEFILNCHRPPLPSFFACFKSIFRLHTETLNIWTHLLGCVAFVAMGVYFLALPQETVWLEEKLAFGAFFVGGAACFAFSSAYHTLWCHSPAVGRLFSKLDYCGIALLIMGSFVPWLYYAFYCRGRLLAGYLALVVFLGALSVLVSLWNRFGEPRYRPLRAGVFVAYGLSGVVPALHFAVTEGWRRAVAQGSLHWLALMGVLYVSGACIYALRVPERFFPGRCDLLFQSHQIFHVFVIIAALVHYHGLTEMAVYRLSFTDCASRGLA